MLKGHGRLQLHRMECAGLEVQDPKVGGLEEGRCTVAGLNDCLLPVYK